MQPDGFLESVQVCDSRSHGRLHDADVVHTRHSPPPPPARGTAAWWDVRVGTLPEPSVGTLGELAVGTSAGLLPLRFDDNSAGGAGGAINLSGYDAPSAIRIEQTTFVGNHAGWERGGAIHLAWFGDIEVSITDTEFMSETADASGGAGWISGWVATTSCLGL